MEKRETEKSERPGDECFQAAPRRYNSPDTQSPLAFRLPRWEPRPLPLPAQTFPTVAHHKWTRHPVQAAHSSSQVRSHPSLASGMSDLQMVLSDTTAASAVTGSAIAASYNDQIRPLLDAVDRLRHLKVTQEGIQLPTIVVVGDQSSGKSSVLESLAGISLPRGQGICTRVPLVMRLQDDPAADSPVLQLEYSNGRVVTTTEANVADAINAATAEIAGSGKGISDAPITLVVRKRGVPDLTLVDLPGITRVPVQGQPDDIYDQIARIIREYIAPKESIILNVLSATVDFPTCESIRMSQQVDRTGERTLAVVTKVDKAPEGLLEKVTMDDVNIGLGYVCVRNRIGEETYDQARVEEERLFKYHPLLSKIDKDMVGIPVLAQRLVQIQATIIAKCLPDIVRQINDRLSRSSTELDQMPPDLNNVADAVREFFHILKLVCASLEKILVRSEFDEYPDDSHFHATARIAEMFDRSAFLVLLKKKVDTVMQVNGLYITEPCNSKKYFYCRQVPHDLVNEVWNYVEDIVVKVLMQHSDNFPQVQSACRRAVQGMFEKARARSAQHVKELIEMEKVADYTANPDYMKTWSEIMQCHDRFMKAVEDKSKSAKITLEFFGEVDVSHMRAHADLARQAFDLRARLTAYWKSIMLRLIDGLALHILLGVKRLVENDLEEELANELLRNKMAGMERMLTPSPSSGTKRERLKKSIVLLRQSKEVVGSIMDRICASGELV
ncbi:dynamin-related protein 4C-like [Triticum aestivum]|uniref:dynamin-related protein 4C-like n=1 Tax=Triticum aestivum TaxID=4565 RepID=UPI001D02735C|nr:dynamin-related protein 4C-like [Triticum aestivum]